MTHKEFLIEQHRKALSGGYVYLARAIWQTLQIHLERIKKETIEISFNYK